VTSWVCGCGERTMLAHVRTLLPPNGWRSSGGRSMAGRTWLLRQWQGKNDMRLVISRLCPSTRGQKSGLRSWIGLLMCVLFWAFASSNRQVTCVRSMARYSWYGSDWRELQLVCTITELDHICRTTDEWKLFDFGVIFYITIITGSVLKGIIPKSRN